MKKILVVCGGGMKGLPAALALDELRRLAGGKLAPKLDMIAGTSIGGIEILFAAIEKSAVKFFTEDGPKIFKKSLFRFWPMYKAEPLEAALRLGLGDATIKNCLTKTLVTSFDKVWQTPFFFKSWDSSNLVLDGATPLWQIGRATSAAQKYFPAFKFGMKKLQDGGNVANNPAVCALSDAVKLWGKDEQVKVLVLGCGASKTALPSWPNWLQELALTISGQFETGSEEVDYQMEAMIGSNYKICQPTFMCPVALDSADARSLSWLQESATRFVQDNRENFDWFLS